jgi:hypothetical protein
MKTDYGYLAYFTACCVGLFGSDAHLIAVGILAALAHVMIDSESA